MVIAARRHHRGLGLNRQQAEDHDHLGRRQHLAHLGRWQHVAAASVATSTTQATPASPHRARRRFHGNSPNLGEISIINTRSAARFPTGSSCWGWRHSLRDTTMAPIPPCELTRGTIRSDRMREFVHDRQDGWKTTSIPFGLHHVFDVDGPARQDRLGGGRDLRVHRPLALIEGHGGGIDAV